MESAIDTLPNLYKHLALWPLAIFFVIGIVSDPDASSNVALMLFLFALLASGLVASSRLAFSGIGIIKKSGYGVLCLIYFSGFIFIIGYHILRLSGKL